MLMAIAKGLPEEVTNHWLIEVGSKSDLGNEPCRLFEHAVCIDHSTPFLQIRNRGQLLTLDRLDWMCQELTLIRLIRTRRHARLGAFPPQAALGPSFNSGRRRRACSHLAPAAGSGGERGEVGKVCSSRVTRRKRLVVLHKSRPVGTPENSPPVGGRW